MPGTFKGRTTRSESSSMRILFLSELHNPRTNDKNGLYVEIPWGNYEPHVTEEEAIKGIRLNLESPLNVSCIPEYQSCIFFSTKGDCGDESLSEMFPYKHEDPGSSLQNPCKDKKKRGKERGKEE